MLTLKNLKNKKVILSVSSALFILILANIISAARPPLTVPLKYPLSLLGLVKREVSGLLFFHRNLIQNQRLWNENMLLRQKLGSLNEEHLENLRLKNLLSFKKQSPYKVIASRVISRPADNWSSFVLIDKGSSSGIRKGMVAISYLGLLGRVVEVSGSTAKIILVNAPEFSVSAIVQRSRQEGLVSGALGPSLVMRYLPKGADLKEGDLIFTSGLTPMYPKGIFIGTVTDAGEEFSGLSTYALIKPALEPSSVEELLVVIQ